MSLGRESTAASLCAQSRAVRAHSLSLPPLNSAYSGLHHFTINRYWQTTYVSKYPAIRALAHRLQLGRPLRSVPTAVP
jgi:hypothetical protein